MHWLAPGQAVQSPGSPHLPRRSTRALHSAPTARQPAPARMRASSASVITAIRHSLLLRTPAVRPADRPARLTKQGALQAGLLPARLPPDAASSPGAGGGRRLSSSPLPRSSARPSPALVVWAMMTARQLSRLCSGAWPGPSASVKEGGGHVRRPSGGGGGGARGGSALQAELCTRLPDLRPASLGSPERRWLPCRAQRKPTGRRRSWAGVSRGSAAPAARWWARWSCLQGCEIGGERRERAEKRGAGARCGDNSARATDCPIGACRPPRHLLCVTQTAAMSVQASCTASWARPSTARALRSSPASGRPFRSGPSPLAVQASVVVRWAKHTPLIRPDLLFSPPPPPPPARAIAFCRRPSPCSLLQEPGATVLVAGATGGVGQLLTAKLLDVSAGR